MSSTPDIHSQRSTRTRPGGYFEAALMVATATLIGLAMASRWGNSAVDLLYLPAVLGAAILGGLRPALCAALASALAYNYFFTVPHRTFRIDNPADVVTVLVLFLVAAVTSKLAASVRAQAQIAAAHAARNATIAGLARRLLSCAGDQDIAAVATSQLAGLFHCNAVLVTSSPQSTVIAAVPPGLRLAPDDVAAAAVTLELGEPAGHRVGRVDVAQWQFHPVRSKTGTIAAIGLARDDGASPVAAGQLSLLENLLDQVALAWERARLENEARQFAAVRERDRIRSALVSSIGQDVTPRLKAIIDAARKMSRAGSGDKALISTIAGEATKLDRYIADLVELGPETDKQPIHAGGVTIDIFRRTVSKSSKDIHLTPKEYAVLAELAKHPGRVLTHAHLLRTAWGPAHAGQTEYLRVAIRSLRQKLEQDPSRPALILNEPAIGYRLVY
jgi:two-component system sensor histidine kinase KdpD